MRIGAERGYRGMVREVLGEIKAELGCGSCRFARRVGMRLGC